MKNKFNNINQLKPSPLSNMFGGFLCHQTYWRPDLQATDPEMPGLKQKVVMYLPVEPNKQCLCGSGKPFKRCCMLDRYWRPICPNKGLDGFSFFIPQEATGNRVDGDKVREALMKDSRFFCTEDTKKRAFWILWGDPGLKDSRYGINCFGDIELQRNRKLIVTAMSDSRMATLMRILGEIEGLPSLEIEKDPVKGFDKRTGEACEIPAK